jgi:hypothetical protein
MNLSDQPHPICLFSKTQFQIGTIRDRLLGVISPVDEGRSGCLGFTGKKDGDTE